MPVAQGTDSTVQHFDNASMTGTKTWQGTQAPDIATQNTAQVPQVPQRSFDSAVLGAVLPAQ
jgi:hypothetical protein